MTPAVRIRSEQAARSAGLRYIDGEPPGISRLRRGRGFIYRYPNGKSVTDTHELNRIRKLAIPPAWASVWICPEARAHVQATGRDDKGRKQYVYHEEYREVRDFTKFNHVIQFGSVLPRIRRRVARDLAAPGMPKTKVVALIVRLMDETCVRVGNEEYARKNRSFGLTTLRNQHAEVDGPEVRFRFRAKSGILQEVVVSDSRLAEILREVQAIRGQHLFQYLDEDARPHTVTSADVNDYLRQSSGEDISAKDFRTWHGTVQTLMELWHAGPAQSPAEAKRMLSAAIKKTAARLGNRPATCKGYYVHPDVLDGCIQQTLFKQLPDEEAPRGRRACEDVLLAIVKRLHRPRKLSPQKRGAEG